jgi:hypothetical protein
VTLLDRFRRRRDRLVISYDPHPDGAADPGEVVWGWVPYEEDTTRGKDRPMVVVGRWGNDLAVVPLTSKHHEDRDHVAVGSGAWDTSGRPSWAMVDRLLRFAPSSVRREGAPLDEDDFDRVVAAVAHRS